MLRKNQSFLSQVYSFADLFCIQISFTFSWWLKFKSGFIPYESHLPFKTYFIWGIVFGAIAIGIGFITNFYTLNRKRRFSLEYFKIIQMQVITLLIFLSILFLYKEIHISRTFLALFLISNVFFMGIYRYIIRKILMNFRKKGYNRKFLLVIGAGSLGKRFCNNLNQYPELGFEVVGFLDDYQSEHENTNEDFKSIIGRVDDLEEILQEIIIDEIIIALPLDAHNKYGNIINICEKYGVKALIIPDFYDYLPARPYFDHFAGIPLIKIRDIPLDELRNRVIKRLFDIVFSSIIILLTLPLLLIIAAIIKLTSTGPMMFKQERVGLNRRRFMMFKFRTMKVLELEASDTHWTIENDPRRTKFGSFLRKTSLDELPQFFNVLMGHMSVVGPRPERPYFVEQFKEEIPKYMVKHHIRPGITGWAQTNGLRGNTSIDDRIRYDIFYIENWTFLFDIKIIYLTIINGFVNKNAY
jgi:Undecaprenyl-phosphate glucose phosphotransferase